ncbi:putative nuclease HARBI1 [Diabrotica virgifera virgifera]|uniref:Putative nuclease HARBI1 n=1 Tax=Diabrotica virgifera virgifera TaxID=50390 RepID=A0ABM5JK21_DIAVI|nr:putative nuclease HARBI1 [Diabrotica virgifera virgifera]
MDLQELEELFEDDDEEIIYFLNNFRTYNVRERKNYMLEFDENEFSFRFRFPKNTVRQLVKELGPVLHHVNLMYHELDATAQVLITLRFYATGSFYIVMGDFGGIHKTTAGRIIKRVTDAIVSLRPQYVKFPNIEDIDNVQLSFYRFARFPKVIGAIDCTHIPIKSPGGNNAEFFRNRKGFFSLNVQVVCDANNYIMDVVCRWPGSCHDSHIFNNSSLKTRFENGEFMDKVLLGDSGYPVLNYLMTPLQNPQRAAEVLYNESHIASRIVIERTFGLLKSRFPILTCGMRCKLPFIQRIITACSVLHNIAIINREILVNDDAVDVDLEQVVAVHFHPGAIPVQRSFINYFETLL